MPATPHGSPSACVTTTGDATVRLLARSGATRPAQPGPPRAKGHGSASVNTRAPGCRPSASTGPWAPAGPWTPRGLMLFTALRASGAAVETRRVDITAIPRNASCDHRTAFRPCNVVMGRRPPLRPGGSSALANHRAGTVRLACCPAQLIPVGERYGPTDAGVGTRSHQSGVAGTRQSETVVGAGHVPVSDERTARSLVMRPRTSAARPTSGRIHGKAGKASPGLRRSGTR